MGGLGVWWRVLGFGLDGGMAGVMVVPQGSGSKLRFRPRRQVKGFRGGWWLAEFLGLILFLLFLLFPRSRGIGELVSLVIFLGGRFGLILGAGCCC